MFPSSSSLAGFRRFVATLEPDLFFSASWIHGGSFAAMEMVKAVSINSLSVSSTLQIEGFGGGFFPWLAVAAKREDGADALLLLRWSGLCCIQELLTRWSCSLPRSMANKVASLQPPSLRPAGSGAGARLLDVAKWFVPGCVEFAGVRGRWPEGGVRASHCAPISVLHAPGGCRRLVAEAP